MVKNIKYYRTVKKDLEHKEIQPDNYNYSQQPWKMQIYKPKHIPPIHRLQNAFRSLDQARLLNIIKDLGYPVNAVSLIGNIYAHSTTIFTGEHFGKTKPIPIQRGTIQADTLSPYLFLIFLEPLLRWLQRGNNGYTFGTSKLTISSVTYADDLAVITNNL